MRLDIHRFLAAPGKRLPVEFCTIPPVEPDQGGVIVQEICAVGEAFAQLGTLYFDVEIRSSEEQPCRRCLARVPVEVVVAEPFELEIPPGRDTVDPLPIVLQMVDSVRDPHVLCRQDCQGLCPRCGTDLNEDPDHSCPEAKEKRSTLRDFLS